MKATFDLPDELYRRVKSRSARLGKPVRAVTIELFERWLEQDAPRGGEVAADEWLRSWFVLGDEYFKGAPKGPSAREILESDRNRLDRK